MVLKRALTIREHLEKRGSLPGRSTWRTRERSKLYARDQRRMFRDWEDEIEEFQKRALNQAEDEDEFIAAWREKGDLCVIT